MWGWSKAAKEEVFERTTVVSRTEDMVTFSVLWNFVPKVMDKVWLHKLANTMYQFTGSKHDSHMIYSGLLIVGRMVARYLANLF